MRLSALSPRRLRTVNTDLQTTDELLAENADLRARLAEAEETLRAIQEGEVDAVVVSGSKGQQVYALSESENLHRLMVETMNEAGLAAAPDGTLMFCNDRACALLGRPKDELLGHDLGEFVAKADLGRFRQLLEAAVSTAADARIAFLANDGTGLPMHVWTSRLERADGPLLCLVATDVRRIEADHGVIARLRDQQRELRDSRVAALNLMEDALAARRQSEQVAAALRENQAALRRAHDELELRVRERTSQWVEANERLQHALDLMNDLYHRAPCGYHSADADGRLVEINDTALQWLGYQREELVGHKTVFHLQTPASRRLGRKSFRRLQRGESVQDLQLEFVRKDGSTLFVSLNATPILDASGKLVRTRSAFVDLTDRVRAERALAASEARLQAILDFSPAMIFLKDLKGRYLLVNHEFERAFGLRQIQVIGRTDLGIFPRKSALVFRANDRLVLRAGSPRVFEESSRRHDGEHSSVSVKFPLRDGRGKVTALGGIAIDITARKRAEAALQASEARFRSFVESAPDAVVIVDGRGRIQLVNAQTERLFGYERKELLGHSLDQLVPARFRRKRQQPRMTYFGVPRTRAMGSGLALFGLHKDGTEFPIEISLSPLDTESGLLVCAAIRDVTARKRIEDALRNSKEHYLALFREAQKARDSLQKLSSLVLHAQEKERKRISRELHDDVGQILTAISMGLRGIGRHGSGDAHVDQKQLGEVERLLNGAIETVHDFARELRPSLLDELGLLPALRSFLKNMAGRTGLRVRFDADPSAEQLGNDEKLVLFRVTQESFNNIVKHAEARHVRVSVTRVNEGVILSIADDGKSFEATQNGTTKRNRLGLLGMRERVRLVDGEFALEARPGKGTTVRALIPMKASAEKAEAKEGTKVNGQ
jgi:PAS domain S-box-containing protein